MDYIFAIFFPGLVLLLKGRILAAIALIALQLTILGWIPATQNSLDHLAYAVLHRHS